MTNQQDGPECVMSVKVQMETGMSATEKLSACLIFAGLAHNVASNFDGVALGMKCEISESNSAAPPAPGAPEDPTAQGSFCLPSMKLEADASECERIAEMLFEFLAEVRLFAMVSRSAAYAKVVIVISSHNALPSASTTPPPIPAHLRQAA